MNRLNNFFFLFALLTFSLVAENNFANGVQVQQSTPIDIDASLADWQRNKAKPLISKEAAGKFDIEKMFVGEDSSNVYFAFKFSGDYKKFEGDKAIEIIFDLDNDTAVGVKSYQPFDGGFSVSGGDYLARLSVEYDHSFILDVYREYNGKFKQKLGKTVTSSSGKIANKGQLVEFKIKKAAFAAPYADGRKFEFDEPMITVLTASKEKYAGEFSASKGEGVKSDLAMTFSPALIVGGVLGLFYIFCFTKIFKKAGLSPVTAVTVVLPPLGLSILNYSNWTLRRKIFRIEDQIAAHQEEEY